MHLFPHFSLLGVTLSLPSEGVSLFIDRWLFRRERFIYAVCCREAGWSARWGTLRIGRTHDWAVTTSQSSLCWLPCWSCYFAVGALGWLSTSRVFVWWLAQLVSFEQTQEMPLEFCIPEPNLFPLAEVPVSRLGVVPPHVTRVRSAIDVLKELPCRSG